MFLDFLSIEKRSVLPRSVLHTWDSPISPAIKISDLARIRPPRLLASPADYFPEYIYENVQTYSWSRYKSTEQAVFTGKIYSRRDIYR